MDGRSAFFLYDSMGFPLDLTQARLHMYRCMRPTQLSPHPHPPRTLYPQLMAREAGLTVDDAGFAAEMQAQRDRSAAAAQAAKGGAAGLELGAEALSQLSSRGVGITDDGAKYGWEAPAEAATVEALWTAGGWRDEVGGGEAVGVVLDPNMAGE